MIDEVHTLELFGYTSDSLSKGSNKKVVRICDECGKVDIIPKSRLHKVKNPNLCKSCSHKGKLNPNFGKYGELSSFYRHKHSDESKEKISKANEGKRSGKNSILWNGGKIIVYCDQCSKQKEIKLSQQRKHNFCNKKCMAKYMSKNRNGENSSAFGKFGEDHPAWKGGFDRSYVLPKSQCIKLNSYFKGSNAHHIMSCVVIFIPKKLHQNIRHNFKSGKNMLEINNLALDYLRGKL